MEDHTPDRRLGQIRPIDQTNSFYSGIRFDDHACHLEVNTLMELMHRHVLEDQLAVLRRDNSSQE
jgi:hypothetical protein